MKRAIVEKNWQQIKVKVNAQLCKPSGARFNAHTSHHVEPTHNIQEASPESGRMLKEINLSRRDVLRGALAVGCSLLAPAALLNSPFASAEPSVLATTKKLSQTSVKYQVKPRGEQKCSNCVNFFAQSNTCNLVEGQISPEGWCVLWAKKT